MLAMIALALPPVQPPAYVDIESAVLSLPAAGPLPAFEPLPGTFGYHHVRHELNASTFVHAGRYFVPLVAANFGPDADNCVYTVTVAKPCDVNADGYVNGEDFDLWSLWYALGVSLADFDRDNFVTGDDHDAFVAAFVAASEPPSKPPSKPE